MPSGNRAQHRFLRISEVIRRVGLSRPNIYRWMSKGMDGMRTTDLAP